VVVDEVARQAAAAEAGRPVRLMFQDEARFGRCQDPRRCWAPPGVRPRVASQFVRESTYAYAALSPHDGAMVSLVLPVARADAMTLFLAEVARRHPDERVVLVLDRAGWHGANDLVVPASIRLVPLPARSPELNPVEHLWEEVREKWFANRAFATLDAAEDQLVDALRALEGDAPRVARLAGFDWITAIPLNAP
jgi:transposase